jgi:hypothetical protein
VFVSVCVCTVCFPKQKTTKPFSPKQGVFCERDVVGTKNSHVLYLHALPVKRVRCGKYDNLNLEPNVKELT